jgi:hypothetical protein
MDQIIADGQIIHTSKEKKEIKKNPIVEKKEKECIINSYNKTLTVYAKLCSANYAEFLDNDSFHSYLSAKCAAHIKLLGTDEKYKYPHTPIGFKFKAIKNDVIYKNKQGNVCFAQDLEYKKCRISLVLIPYDFISDINHIYGISLRASLVQEV